MRRKRRRGRWVPRGPASGTEPRPVIPSAAANLAKRRGARRRRRQRLRVRDVVDEIHVGILRRRLRRRRRQLCSHPLRRRPVRRVEDLRVVVVDDLDGYFPRDATRNRRFEIETRRRRGSGLPPLVSPAARLRSRRRRRRQVDHTRAAIARGRRRGPSLDEGDESVSLSSGGRRHGRRRGPGSVVGASARV